MRACGLELFKSVSVSVPSEVILGAAMTAIAFVLRIGVLVHPVSKYFS